MARRAYLVPAAIFAEALALGACPPAIYASGIKPFEKNADEEDASDPQNRGRGIVRLTNTRARFKVACESPSSPPLTASPRTIRR
jgi:hypothetical protein